MWHFLFAMGAHASGPGGVLASDVDSGRERIDVGSFAVESGPSAQVVGGVQSQLGNWPSTVGVVMGGQVGCTGTLVAPTVVLTAGHCVVGTGVSAVRVGTVNVNNGTVIPVAQAIPHPTYDNDTYAGSDIAVLILAQPATQPTAIIAADCIADDELVDGAPAAIVGFGAINEQGNQYSNWMHEGIGSILDADCSQNNVGGVETTCAPSERPAGELFAGGNVDACFGDSGGPLYVQGDDGIWYVAGVTSRGGWAPGSPPCGIGGVWARPDAHLPWIESLVGPLPRPTCGQAPAPAPAPAPVDQPDDGPPSTPSTPNVPPAQPPAGVGGPPVATADLMVVPKRHLGAVQIRVEDPDSVEFTYEVVRAPLMGEAEVQPDGLALYRPGREARGLDSFDVRVVDPAGNEAEITVLVQLVGAPVGCATAPVASGWLAAFGLLLGLGRRARA